MADSLTVRSIDGIINKVNQAAINLLGYEEKELLGNHIDLVFGSNMFE